MNISQKGLLFIKEEEGCRLETYYCPAGIATIGIGHTSSAGFPEVKEGMKITEREALEILKSDIRKFEGSVNKLVNVSLTQSQFDALVSLVFNIGEGNFSKSTLLKKLNKGDYNGAASEFHRWNKAGGKVNKGLTNRRAREAALFVEDDWATDEEPVPQGNITRNVPTIVNPENIAAATTVTSAVASSNMDTNNPITWAIAILMVAAGGVFLYMFLRRRGA